MPLGVTSIGEWAFKNCYRLKNFTLSIDITTIGDNAFKNAKIETLYILCDLPATSTYYPYFESANIGHAIIGGQVTSIGAFAFIRSNIQKLTLGENFLSLGEYALYDCKQLTEIYCKSEMPPLAASSFRNLASIDNIYVPISEGNSVINAYKSADGWSDYATYIKEYDFSK